jgi:hypothetical protein
VDFWLALDKAKDEGRPYPHIHVKDASLIDPILMAARNAARLPASVFRMVQGHPDDEDWADAIYRQFIGFFRDSMGVMCMAVYLILEDDPEMPEVHFLYAADRNRLWECSYDHPDCEMDRSMTRSAYGRTPRPSE